MDRRRSERAVVAPIPVVAALGFIYENYTVDCWFWETIEITRKLLLTSSLALIGAEGRTSLGVASVLSGVYAMLHAQYKPIPDRFEHVLQLTSLLVTFANTCIGMMLKIDQTKILDDDAKIMDSMIISVLLVTANVMVTVLVVGLGIGDAACEYGVIGLDIDDTDATKEGAVKKGQELEEKKGKQDPSKKCNNCDSYEGTK
ncbi:hypothetical protein QZH41_004906 [Actinostola sp. cb2023]|nr:hypothetical protein QZH41_004906 [Actinostola sp. cb2023]